MRTSAAVCIPVCCPCTWPFRVVYTHRDIDKTVHSRPVIYAYPVRRDVGGRHMRRRRRGVRSAPRVAGYRRTSRPISIHEFILPSTTAAAKQEEPSQGRVASRDSASELRRQMACRPLRRRVGRLKSNEERIHHDLQDGRTDGRTTRQTWSGRTKQIHAIDRKRSRKAETRTCAHFISGSWRRQTQNVLLGAA